MTLTLTVAPTVEPVSLSEAKAFLRVGHADEDTLINDLIRASREQIELWTGLALIEQSWRETLDDWPPRRVSACGHAVRLARRPLVSVDALKIYDGAGGLELVDPSRYRFETGDASRLIADGPSLLPRPKRSSGSIEIEYTAGFGTSASDVPAALREAILHLTASRYGNAERAQSAQRDGGVPDPQVEALIAGWRRVGL